MFSTLIQDFRFGFRMLRKSPGVSAAAILTPALGIGANTVIFTGTYSLLVQPLPFKNAERIVTVAALDEQNAVEPPASYPEFQDWKDRTQIFETVIARRGWSGGEAVSEGFFPMIGVQPVLGRMFSADEHKPGAAPVVIMDHDVWKNRFARSPAGVGTTVSFGDRSFTIIGVLPER